MPNHLKLLLCALAACVVAAPLSAQSRAPFRDGEQFVYRVGWGIFFAAGQLRIAAHADPRPDGATIAVDTVTETRGLVRGIFPFTAEGESVIDRETGRLLSTRSSSSTRVKSTKTSMALDYMTGHAIYRDDLNPARSKQIDMPPGNPSDLIIGLIQTRAWSMKPGDQRDMLAIFEDEFYLLTIHALGYETVETPMGVYRTIVLEPKMEKMAPKGMFKRGSEVKVWIAQDEGHLPVRFSVEFKFGAGVASLVSYTPPHAGAQEHAQTPRP